MEYTIAICLIHGTQVSIGILDITRAHLKLTIIGCSAMRVSHTPIPNDALARPIHTNYGREYLAIDYIEDKLTDIAFRNLFILSDTVIHLEPIESPHGLRFELTGDALFLLNSLSARRDYEPSVEVMSYQGGFRPHSKKPHTTYFMRAVNALDAMAVEPTGRPMIERTNFGSGNPSFYRLYQDINRIDLRPGQGEGRPPESS